MSLIKDTVNEPLKDWKYYNHAAIPTTAPHLTPDIKPITDGSIWDMPGKPYLARWTSDFDCGYETEWWYCIKDTPFDIMQLRSKKRYEINKGVRNFDVKKIDPKDKIEDLLSVTLMAYQKYPLKYRPNIDMEEMERRVAQWKNAVVFGAFEKGTDCICGYAVIILHREYAEFSIQKTNPQYEKKGINAALINEILCTLNVKLRSGYYICDGERNISHETAFQDYLEKYFGFRKAYCKLNLKYSKKLAYAIQVLYPIRFFLKFFDGIKLCHYANSVVSMEKLRRSFHE